MIQGTHIEAKRAFVTAMCLALGINRATYYCLTAAPIVGCKPRRRQPRALTAAQGEAVVAQLHEPRFVDLVAAVERVQSKCSPWPV
jgi:hypothetical protein